MIKERNKQQILIKHESHKKHRNKTIVLIGESKHTYYQHLFEQNKKDFKTIWKGIHEIMFSTENKMGSNVSVIIAVDNTITFEIVENFNNFFTSIGTNLQEKIPPKRICIYRLFEKTKL